MALGENKRNDFHPTVYGYQFSNPEAKVDKTALTFNWWNKMLKLSIAPKLNNGGDYSQYDHKNAISIYLSVQSAKALQIVTEDFVAWLKENAGQGKEYNRAIQVKNGIVLLSNGGFIHQPDTPCVVIAKINESGKVESSYAYEFKIDYQFSIEGYNPEDGSYRSDTSLFTNMEPELMVLAIDQYVKAVTGMVAGSVVNELQPMRDAQRKIADKLGVSLGNFSGGQSTRTSYFNNQAGASESQPASSTLDEIENM